MEISIQLATLSDIDDVMMLQAKYHVDSINENDRKDGFVTTLFSREQLSELIVRENGLVIAKAGKNVVAYIMVASWQYWSAWPLFAHMINDLSRLHYQGYDLDTANSFQYGPICIDKSVRGEGVLENIFAFTKAHMSHRYPVLVTFINQNNRRSYEAHKRKLKLDVINEFHFNDNHYFELACLTRQD
ncbi:hypothetical protein OAP63_12295 [Vibrio sp.]|nr:hypothetical protein [Vibrio sp.]